MTRTLADVFKQFSLFCVMKGSRLKRSMNLLQISTHAYRIHAKTTEYAMEGQTITTATVLLALPDRPAIEV